MVIEVICQYPQNIVMGVSAGIGALGYAVHTIYKKSKEDKNFKFSVTKILDTAWQSIGAGVIAGTAIGCGYFGIITALLAGMGIDKLANKSGVLNLIELIANLLTKADKKR